MKASVESAISYGRERFSLPPFAGECVGWLTPMTPTPQQSAEAIIRSALARPIGSQSLRELAEGKGSAAILIPGIDRIAGANVYVPELVRELTAAKIPEKRITIHLATGTHLHHGQDDLIALLGRETASQIRCISHDCKAESEFEDLGTTVRGTPVLIHKGVMQAEVKVTTGRIIPHYFAGYSGGRKTLLPGVAAFRSITANHRLTLSPDVGIHPAVAPCSLADNPVHLDMLEAAGKVNATFCLNTLFDVHHRMIDAVAGDPEEAHRAGCELAQSMFQQVIAAPVDGLITSAGGDPYDCNFMQALKAAFNVQTLVRDGGAMLWIAKCPGGIHPGFLDWAQIMDDEMLEIKVRAGYNLTGHNSVMLRQMVRRLRVALWSTLPDSAVKSLGMHPVRSLEEGLGWLGLNMPRNPRYAVVPAANVLHGTVSP